MAALLRSQDALDLESAIREWQSRQNERQHGGSAPEPDEKSAVARLTAALDTLFREIVVILSDKGKFPRDIFISLDRSRSCFSLWSDGHGVASGSLDDKFQRSRKLRQATMKTLSHLSSTLTDRLVPVAHISNPKTKGLCDQVSNILEEVNFSHVADDSSSDSTSEYSTADVHELAEDLKTDVDCLIELDQMIRDPATDPEPETVEADVSLSSWAPHQVFANKIEHRFPGADSKLFSSLGMINYQRYLRCQTERNRNQVHAEQPEQAVQVTTGSKFHDSGLGSSLNPASSYAETIMSYRDGNRSVRIPPLPEEAKGGEAFPCVACGSSVIITTNSQWKRHLYIDLQPYVCLDTSCQRSDSTFSNRANWLQHMALDHGMEPNWQQIKCPLCGDEAGPGEIAITTHLGRHLEEISLSALPVAPDSETNSEASESDIDNNNYQVNQDNEEEPQDLEAVEVESEGEISDQTSNISLHSGVQSYGRGSLPLEPSVDSWKTWEDLIDAANREAAGGATGDQPPISSGYLASPSVKPTAGDEMLVKYLQARPLEMQVQRDTAMQQEKQKQTVELSHEPEVQIHNEKEAAFHRRMGEMKTAQEEAKREIEKARIEAEEAAYQRLKAEQKAEEEERARLYAQAIAVAEEAAYKRIKAERAEEDRLRAELKAMEARRQPEPEIQDSVKAEKRAKILELEEAHRRQREDMKAAHEEAIREIEEDYRRRREDMKVAQEEAKREIEKAKVEAEKAVREILVAERKAEEERSRKHAEAMVAAEENARLRFEAELKAGESRRQIEAEARDRADKLKFEAAVKADKDHRENEAEARTQVKEAQKKYDAELKASKLKAAKARWPGKSRSSALVSELGNGEGDTENHETGESRQRRKPRRAAAPTWNFEQPGPDTDDSMPSTIAGKREASVEADADMKSPQGQAGVQFGDQQFNLGAHRPNQQIDHNLLARAARISEQQRRAVAAQAEKEARDKAEAEARLKLDDTVKAANEERGQEHVKTRVVPNGPRQEVRDRTADVEHNQRLDNWQARRWRWTCPSCGSEDQDRRKGPVCSNCSYLVGDGDGFETSVPEQRQHIGRSHGQGWPPLPLPPQSGTGPPRRYALVDNQWVQLTAAGVPRKKHGRKPGTIVEPRNSDGNEIAKGEIVTEEQLQKQHRGSPEHQAAFTSVERAPQAEHQRSPEHAEQSVPDSTTNNHRNAPNSGAKYVPRELSFLEPSFGIDSHTAASKRKLNPIRLSTPDDRPLSGLDSNDPPVLPPIQLGNAKGIHTTIPSLDEDNGLVDGPRDVDRDWSLITDLAEAEQRRRANRMAQRAYRQKLKRRLEDLERRADAADGQGSDQSGTSKDGPLNDIPTSPAQRSLGSARDRNRDRDVDRGISYGSGHETPDPLGHNFPTDPREPAPHEHGTQMRQKMPSESGQRTDDLDQWQQSDRRSLSAEPPAFQAAPEPRTTSHTRHRTPSPPEPDGSASHQGLWRKTAFESIGDIDDDLDDESWLLPQPL